MTLERLVSPYTGVVRSTPRFLYATDDPRLVKVGVDGTTDAALLGLPLDHLVGSSGGAAPTATAARAAALGEAAERYAASYLPEHEFVLAAADDLADAVAPESFALFHERQHALPGFAFVPFTRSTRVRWARGFRVADGRPSYVPVQLVYLARSGQAGEAAIGYATSNGTACGDSLDEALLRGLLELVERDAFMIAWTNRLSLPRLVWDDDEELAVLDRRHFAPTGLRYEVVDLSALLAVPAAVAVVSDAHGAIGVGAGAAPTAAGAWLKALAEAFSVRTWARSLREEHRTREFRPDFSDVETFADHVLFYAAAERAVHAAFLTASEERVRPCEVQPLEGAATSDHLEALLWRLAEAEVDAYAVDVTSPDVREAGLYVVKAVCPQLCALDTMHVARFLGGRRILEAAYERGLAPRPLRFEKLNPYPHPFP